MGSSVGGKTADMSGSPGYPKRSHCHIHFLTIHTPPLLQAGEQDCQNQI